MSWWRICVGGWFGVVGAFSYTLELNTLFPQIISVVLIYSIIGIGYAWTRVMFTPCRAESTKAQYQRVKVTTTMHWIIPSVFTSIGLKGEKKMECAICKLKCLYSLMYYAF